jgi:hypothetical protein
MRKTSPTQKSGKWLGLAIALPALFAGGAFGQNVLQPSDPIIASSANSPGSEGVKNAIDGTQAKYLNFDSATNTSGFVVTPQVGVTWVTGIAMESANDAPERDPKEVTLEGSNDDTITNFSSGNWEMIADIQVPAYTARFQTQTFTFSNFKPYKSYRWTVVSCQGPNQNSMQIAEVQLLGEALPGNVLVPSDPIIASSANSPGSEGVKNAIDGTQAKYLNFDSATNTSGFVVTPSVGATVAQGLAMESANDAPERDPKVVTLEGSNDDVADYTTTNWTLIATVNVPAYTARFQTQTFLFPNVIPYKHYRWTVVQCQGPNQNSMQIAEVQILGTSAPANILVPSDPIIASSANSPGSEGVKNAIDGTQAKYLNFDSATNTSGFVVTPSVGSTTITGLAMESANDAPERDPKEVKIEGSNDDVADYTTTNWTTIIDIPNIPAFTNRFEFQYFYFQNSTPYKHYKWTVVTCQGPNQNSMQIAEVQLLAITSKADCSKAAFVSTPIDTPVLAGSSAEFFVDVNGPWPLQWYTNGVAVPGATKGTLTTDLITTSNATIAYSVAIVGCQTSAPVHAVIFTPSTTKSIGIQFAGGGANGAPTYIQTNDIVGIQQQAFWNSAVGASGASGDGTSVTNGLGNADSLTDSDGNTNAITFEYHTSGTWGAGVGTDQPVQRMLNGLVGYHGTAGATSDQVLTFHNVPAGNHAILIYSVSPPLQFEEVKYAITNQNMVVYQRTLNSDEYKPAPGFYRSTSTTQGSPSIGNFVRFDGVKADANGDVNVTFNVLDNADRETGVNAIQLVLNAPNPGSPPTITGQPQPTVSQTNGSLTLSVTATGTGLSYQWRKDGINLINAGHVSGATSPTLVISPFTAADEGIYSVAIFNQAGSTISDNASALISNYSVSDRLAVYMKFNETTGTNATNSASGGLPANFTVASGANLVWGTGKVGGDVTLDDQSWGFISNFTKASGSIAGQTWVNVSSTAPVSGDMTLFRNQEGDFQFGGTANRIIGQFELMLHLDATSNTYFPLATVGLGNNYVRATSPTAISLGAWHHIAFSADGAQLRLYVDGHEVTAVDYTGLVNVPNTPWISIGQRVVTVTDTNSTPPFYTSDPANNSPLFGGLDELALWDRALTASEVTALYNAGQSGKEITSIVLTPPAGGGTLKASVSGGNITVTWSSGTLQSATSATGPWTNVPGAAGGTFTESISGAAAKFYRSH